MRYRRLDPETGDYTFGRSQGNFWIDQPEGVAQSVMTRLRLEFGTWFADTGDGTPWATQVLGERTRATRDVVVQDRTLGTIGVTTIANYASTLNVNTREWTAAMVINTVYGQVALATAKLPGTVPPLSTGGPTRLLGVVGARDTPLRMTRANLAQAGDVAISDFVIQRIDGARY